VKRIFSGRAWEDYLHWQFAEPNLTLRINGLLKECLRTPFSGTGKPEPLRGEMKSFWSRRIDQEHRLVYKLGSDGLLIAQCRYHY
jgi:toxin YoeB